MRNILSARLLTATLVLGLLMFCSGQPGSAQTPLPLSLDNNYMVTGDYVVGGWLKATTSSGTSTGTIGIPDSTAYGGANLEERVPAGADIVAAFLYWATVENSGVHSGQNGFFSGTSTPYPIAGTVLGNPNAPVSWSSGGCAGAANGSKTIVTYRADVSALLPVDANGNVQPNATYTLSLPDTGKAGQPPFALGATLVIVYRLLAPGAGVLPNVPGLPLPLNAVIIYDGAFAPSNASQTMTQPMIGFYDAGNDQQAAIATKITHIVANGQNNKLQSVMLNNANLASLYGNLPPFPGMYNGSWDNPTWTFQNGTNGAVNLHDPSATTSVVPASSNKGCVSWGAIVMSTTVQDSDHDGLPDASKASQGYYDAGANRGMSNQGTCTLNQQGACTAKVSDPSWVSLSGATQGQQDMFIQLDYMCTKVIANNPNVPNVGTCDPSGVSYKPVPDPITNSDPIANLVSAFKAHGINVHIVTDDNNVIQAQTCLATPDKNGNYCANPGQAGVVGWKLGYTSLKTQPLNYPDEPSCETLTPPGGAPGSGPRCLRRFPYGQNNSYHEVMFAVASAVPSWYFLNGSLVSVTAKGNILTLTTSTAHGLAVNSATQNGRITIDGAISNPSLNGTYLVQGVPSSTSFTIQVAAGTIAPTNLTDPSLSVSSGVVGSGSGVSDIGGADSLISLGLWGADGQTVPVESGTFMHELGHSLGLTHGGLFRTWVGPGPQDYSFSFDPNCKPNHQSVMNYMFQVELLDGVLDYSDEALNTLDEVNASPPNALGTPMHPTTKWYAPNQTFGSPATAHCDGTPIPQTTPPQISMWRLQGPDASISWAAGQDINFDGQIEASYQGFNDWLTVDLRQIGATGNSLWASGAVQSVRAGGATQSVRAGGATQSVRAGGVGDFSFHDASAFVRNPTGATAAVTPANTVNVSFTPPGFGQSLIDHFNVYRSSVNPPQFSPPAYGSVSVTGMTLPLSNQLTFPDTKVSCGATYSYFVTTVLSDGRESVPSNTTRPPVSVNCAFVGFLSPMSTASQAPAPPTFSGARNLGNAVPIKWALQDGSGNPISDLTTLKLMQACSTTGPTSLPSATCVLIYSPLKGGEGSTTFRFSSPDFIINYDTGSSSNLTTGYWTIELELSDGRTEWTNIKFQ